MRKTGQPAVYMFLAGLMVQLWLVLGLAAWVSCSGTRDRREAEAEGLPADGLVREGEVRAPEAAEEVVVPDGAGDHRVSASRVVTREGPPGLVRLLGQCGIEGPGRDVGARARDMWALLGLLAEHRTVLLTRTAVQDKLWSGAVTSPDKFANLLKETRGKFCDALGRPGGYGRVVIQLVGGSGYRINPDLFTCDVWLLRDLLARASMASGDEKSAALLEAVESYSGEYLAGVPHSWAQNAAEGVTRDVVQALVQLADLAGAVELEAHYLERATELDGCAEHLFRRRMEAYAKLGRTQAVHYCYDELRAEMKNRGRNPAARTEDIYLRATGAV